MFFFIKALVSTAFFLIILESAYFAVYLYSGGLKLFIAILILNVLYSATRSYFLGGRARGAITLGIFTFSTTSLLYLIDSFVQSQIYIILAGLLFYIHLAALLRLKEYEKDETAKALFAAVSMACLFFFFCLINGIYLNTNVPLWVLMTFFALAVYLVSSDYFYLISNNGREVRLFSFTLALVMAETGWVLSFWPFGYLTTSAVAIILFYIFWDIAQGHFLGLMSEKKILIDLLILFFLSALLLSTVQWIPKYSPF